MLNSKSFFFLLPRTEVFFYFIISWTLVHIALFWYTTVKLNRAFYERFKATP